MNDLSLVGGLLLGLASSLHCAGMCAGIAGSLAMMLAPEDGPRWRGLMVAQAGRVLAYVLAGAILGGMGAGFYGLFDHRGAYRVLQWAGAAGLAWVGLSLWGLVPSPRGLDRLAGPIGRVLSRPAGHGMGRGLLAGAAWGMLPCGMVYAALLYAMLAGSAGAGATVMLGFAAGTLPAVTVAGLGLQRLRGAARGPATRRLVGAALIGVGGLSILLTPGLIDLLCLPG